MYHLYCTQGFLLATMFHNDHMGYENTVTVKAYSITALMIS